MNAIDAALQAAGAALSFLQSGSGQGGAGVAKGLAGITAFVNQVLTALDNIAAQVASMPLTQRRTAAQSVAAQIGQLVASLSDPSQVYQAKKGKDAAALAQGKSAAAEKAAQISALLRGGSATSVITNPVTGTVTPTETGAGTGTGTGSITDAIAAPDNQIYIWGGLALVAILLLRKK